MQWKQLFTPAQELTADQARAFMAERTEGSYALVDVRQPREYERERIPGSKLIPLPELSTRLDELERDMPTLVY